MITAFFSLVGQVLLFCLTMNIVLVVIVGVIVLHGWLMRHVNRLTSRGHVVKSTAKNGGKFND